MVLLCEREGIEDHAFVVIGGLSSIGSALCLQLLERGAREVRCFDWRCPSPALSLLQQNGVKVFVGNLNDKNQLEKAFRGANCVFHLALHGISGKEMLQAGKIDEVNLTGTLNVLESCTKAGVERLVYLSTYNVIFGGRQISNGNEAMDYFPMENQLDSYGRCKSLAEQLVLKSNGRPLKEKSGRKFYTCIIRPAAVYGPGEEYHVPRFVNLAQKGMFHYLIGGNDVKTDWVYVDNLIQALLLASMGLIDDIPGRKGAPASGQAYFISDGAPVNSFDFMKPLIEGLGYKLPHRRIDVKHAMIIAWIFWGLYGLMYPWLDKSWLPQPPILPAEVYKVGITHYFSILKAKRDLGYVPFVEPKEGIRRTLEFWKDRQANNVLSPAWYIWVILNLGMFLTFCVGFLPPASMGILEWVRYLGLFLFRSQRMLQVVFVSACLVHVLEGVYAWVLARKVDPKNAKAWFWQTVDLGGPSLYLLIKRSKQRASELEFKS